MKLLLIIVISIIIGYKLYSFVQLLVKIKGKAIIPATEEEMQFIRKHPERVMKAPTFSSQKTGVFFYSLFLLFMISLFLISIFAADLDWSFYLFFLLPFTYTNDVLNIFAVVEDGVLSGNRFISWRQINYFYMEKIDVNHKFYGYSKEANEGYELKMKLKFLTVSCCVITSDNMKEKLIQHLGKHRSFKMEVA